MISGKELIVQVAAILENRYWTVEVEKYFDGIQIDLLAHDSNKNEVIIECKAYSRLVGLRTIREFASAVDFLREARPRLQAWLVTTSGFTSNAQKALERYKIQGLTLDELSRRSKIDSGSLKLGQQRWREEAAKARRKQKRVFVIVPFSEEMLDVFILGIRWAASQLEVAAKRADDLEHNGEIIDEIRKAIAEYDAVVADTSGANPNVCYEVGFAHALKKPTILICRKGTKLPFDLQGTNHLMYETIISLREPLKAKLAAALSDHASDL